jgi:photosystem II stability/assembly factor-like uncharacterized protein
MRALTIAGLLACAATMAFAADELVWKSLFAPPYSEVPEITMSIACISKSLCYVPGGSNGAGFGVFSFNGQTNGELIQMTEPNMTMMILAVAAGGTAAQPHAAFGGVGMLTISEALQYLSDNGTTWLPSTIPSEFVWETNSMSSTDDGQHIISLGSGVTGNSIMHSKDSGKSFNPIVVNVTALEPNCTMPGAIAMVNGSTWIMTMGGYPGEHQHSSSHGSQSQGSASASSSFGGRVNNALGRRSPFLKAHHDDNGRIIRSHSRKNVPEHTQPEHCSFTGQILKTSDAGKTWTSMLNSTTYTLTQIDCISANHCVTIGYGVNAQNESLSVILTMMDGKTWNETAMLVNSPYNFESVQFADAQEVWIGGGYETQQSSAGAFYYSMDGGATWQAYANQIPNLVTVFDMSFTKDGTGFAVGMTEFKTSTILRYDKQSFAGYFTQLTCPFAGCTLCEQVVFPQGMCLEAQGGSVSAFCSATAIEQHVYNTTSCVGPYDVVPMAINQCLNSTQGGFFENICNTTGSKVNLHQRPVVTN